MKHIAMLIVAALGLLSATAQAEEEKDFSLFLPSEMMYDGKLIDPRCVYAEMMDHTGGGLHLDQGCPEFSGDGTDGLMKELVQKPGDTYGYDFSFEDRRSGGFYYQIVGKTSEGTVLNINYSFGGTGKFSSLDVFQRDGDVFRFVRRIVGGDRCSGGIRDARMEDGHLLYSYDETPLGLYRHYIPASSYRSDMGSGFVNCGAVVSMQDDAVRSVELVDDAIYPDCFAETYNEQITTKRILSDAEAKALFEDFARMCPEK